MFITTAQLFCHFIGDYVLQSHWMAYEKMQRNLAAWAHGFMYGLPFLFLRPHWHTFAIIVVTHWTIDHFKLARFVCYAKNFISPRFTFERIEYPRTAEVATSFDYKKNIWWHPWSECSETGYHKSVPPFLAVWLYVIVDNLMHITLNGFAFWVEPYINW